MSLIITSHPAPSASYSPRPADLVIEAVVIHRLAPTLTIALHRLTNPATRTTMRSWHYTIARDGSVMQHAPDDKRAAHTGASLYAGRSNWDDFSVGIGLVGSAGAGYTAAQYAALGELLDALAQRHPLHPEYIVGHDAITAAPGPRHNPGPRFDWARLHSAAPRLWPAERLPR